eukprot:525937_1
MVLVIFIPMSDIVVDGLIVIMAKIGEKTGIFDAAEKGGPQTVDELAKSARVNERYVREWLSAMACAKVFNFDVNTRQFSLGKGTREFLKKSANVSDTSHWVHMFGQNIDRYVDVFRNGGGVGYEHFENFHEMMGNIYRSTYDNDLVQRYLPLLKDIHDRLQSGESLKVLDVGCGSGHAINVMAKAFPNSDFVGLDISATSIGQAEAEARDWGLTNARFAVVDVGLPLENEHWCAQWGDATYDLVCAFDAVHDQAKPQQLLNNISAVLKPDGAFLMQDIMMSSKLENNLEVNGSAQLYSISTLHCMTVSLAQGGAGLGTCWGTELAQEMLKTAGFTNIKLFPASDHENVIYIARK